MKKLISYNDKKEIIYLSIIKIFACFMVIINHTNGILLNNNFVNTTFYCLTFSISKTAVALFLMVSGSLLLDKEYSLKKIIKCIFRVLTPVLFVTFLLYIKSVGISNIKLITFFKSFISKPYMIAYWYIYALIGIYITLPFLQKMIKNFSNRDYMFFIIIFLLFPSLINSIKGYIKLDIDLNFTLAFFPIIIAIVICGNYISKTRLNKKYFMIAVLTFIISYMLMFLSMYIPYLNNNSISYILDSYCAFPVVTMSISIFYIIRYVFENREINDDFKNTISIVASTTFGIYLIHCFLNYKLYEVHIIKCIFEFNNILGIVVLDILVFIVSMIITCVLKKIPVIKSFL